jgi:hypothetical protein
MSYTSNYLPIPPRAWSRVETRCTFDTSVNDNSSSYDPFVFRRLAQLNKGNVLQYKINSSQLTKKQRYSQIAKGMWTNRTKTWATQSITYSNPNTTSLKRFGFIEYPRNDITPGSPANPAGPYVPVGVLSDPFNCPNFTFKDGGSLICSAYENPCTGEVVERTFQQNYYPTSDSDVPGPIQYLYWDPRLQTWFPRQRLTMNNSTNKWPINYKLFKSAIQPNAPTLEIVSSTSNSVELSWTISNNTCYPVSSFAIFVNNSLFKTIVNSTNYTTTLTGLNSGPYDIYITAILSGNTSPPSNIVVYNNEVVVKSSLNADNKTYSDSVIDLSNQITDIASGNIGNGTGNGGNGNGNGGNGNGNGGNGNGNGGNGNGNGGNGNGNGGNGTGNGGSSIFNTLSDYYVIENTNNSSNSIVLPDNLTTENNKTIRLFNKTGSELTILSPVTIYSTFFAPNGTNALILPINSTVEMNYVYNNDGIQTIHASVF